MSNTMYHVTPRRNVPSILKHGLKVSFAMGRIEGVWLCDDLRLPWALAHVSRHQGLREEYMSIISVDATGLTLRNIRIGVKVSCVDIEAKRMGEVNYFAVGEP